jgi:hypothetical protein
VLRRTDIRSEPVREAEVDRFSVEVSENEVENSRGSFPPFEPRTNFGEPQANFLVSDTFL